MSTAPRNDFCLWIVPPRNGKVRKFRMSLRLLALGAGVAGVAALLFAFVASDYSRVQFLRLKHYLTLKRVIEERDSLQGNNVALKGKLDTLAEQNLKASRREEEVKHRLEALASIIKSAPFKELHDAQTSKVNPASKSGGVGGAEIDCSGIASSRCSAMLAHSQGDGSTNGAGALNLSNDLINTLDKFIDELKIMPFGTPVNGDVSSAFGYRISPFHLGIRMHEGVDFSLATGSEIRATADGVVKSVERDGTYGLKIDIAHTDNLITRYAHLSSAKVVTGQKIERNQVVGLVGSTGRSTGPHLHYEVRINGEARNPQRYIDLADKLLEAFPG